MKEPSDVTALIVDNDRALFLPLAVYLGQIGAFKRVLYHCGPDGSFPTIGECSVGKGFEGVERCDSPLSAKSEVDLLICPDINTSDIQKDFENSGIAVWGSGYGDELENRRILFHETLDKIGLLTPPYHVCKGLQQLVEYLKDKKDVFLKISRYRGSWETRKFRNMDLDSSVLHIFAQRFGPMADKVRVVVCDKIETDLELGADAYNVSGAWPDYMLNGWELKDRAYLSSITRREDMPKQIIDITEAVAPLLAKYNYRNFISFEDRVAGDKHYWIDATQRFSIPASPSQCRAWKNLPLILWHGAHGELVQPESSCKFTAECLMTMKSEPHYWSQTEFDGETMKHAAMPHCCIVDGFVSFPPGEPKDGSDIGWLCATGDTIEEVVDTMKGLADNLPDGVDADTDSLVDLLSEVSKAEDEGIEFSEQNIPAPETALNV
jgi:hypothetical protein